MNKMFRLFTFFLFTLNISAKLFADSTLPPQEELLTYVDNNDEDSCYEDSCYSDNSSFFIRADVLYWRAAQEGLDLLVSGLASDSLSSRSGLVPPIITIATRADNDSRERFKSDWRGGYRLGIGGSLCSGWVLSADWSHYRGKARTNPSAPPGEPFPFIINPDLIEQIVADTRLEARGLWNLKYDVLDFLIRTPTYCAIPCFSWNVFGGLKAASIQQGVEVNINSIEHFTIINQGVINDLERITNSIISHHRTNSRFLGPEIGFHLNFNLGYNFSFYGDLAGSLLYGRFNNKTTENGTLIVHNGSPANPDGQVTTTTSVSRFRRRDNMSRYVLDYAIGVSWMHQFSDLRHFSEPVLVAKLGWEHHQWSDIDRISTGGDLYLSGCVLSAQLFF